MIKIVLDMDDTIAHFDKMPNALERFKTEKGFFTKLQPSKMLTFVKGLIANDIIKIENVYIVSASPNVNADNDKMAWLEKHFKELRKENILFSRLGENKSQLFKNKYNVNDLSNYYLIDDYTQNLIQWANNGGKVLKYINEYNNTKQNYKAYNIKAIKL